MDKKSGNCDEMRKSLMKLELEPDIYVTNEDKERLQYILCK